MSSNRNKRKAGAEEQQLDDTRKRSRRFRNVKEELDDLRQFAELMDILRSHRTEDNRFLCESFIRNPSRRTDPKYFEVIAHPIDLTRIQQKIKTEEYVNVEDLTSDISLLVSNHKAYYEVSTLAVGIAFQIAYYRLDVVSDAVGETL
ncbi:unnamed protein product [Gongylonema pulchrum]|uniref:Bromo domain-containing protein n=1 Tax=Gongylonema pulchrum TaxID=637853 RepID=A0A183ES84_9BILA|nr:unnamed protein product [Gongylonema pulchrum]